ncbi:UNVERIFIED_CONTAM: hypothetical protein Sangu_0897200 [Sesamum angustifolium]|uniref:DUF7032 domain-containing protein n=1 Tax=Sesamum angustifolium TaxID=2727405 RepID=A0AAW2PBC0_9LAMI
MGEEKKSTTRDQSSAEETRLHQAIVLISSLISLSHSIRVFPTKWQSIGNKLEELLSNLTAIGNCQSTDNFSLSVTLETIVATLNNCAELGKRCSELSYSGKLLMQSDLDIVSAKIDAHIQSISDIYAMGLLTQSNAIVVSRPSVSASRDDIKFYIVDLLSRFKIGSSDMKKQALVAFNDVIQEDDRYLKIALELDSFVNFLVNFLDLKDSEIQEEAAKASSLIAGFESYKSVLIGAGIIAPLIRVLESGSDQSKKIRGKICGNTVEHDGELVGLACGVLKNLVGVEEIRRFVVEEGAILEFVNLLRSKNEVIKVCSVDLLQAMAYGDESIRDMIQGGGIRAIVRALDPRSSFSTKTREVAFRGIVNICCSSDKSLNLLINYGFMDHILYFLRYGEVPVQELALKAAFWLSGTSEEGKKVMGDAGFMPVLVKFLDSNSLEIREVAAETLSSMIIVPRNQKRFVQNDQNVGLLLQMLDPMEVNTGNKKLLLSILMSLTSSNSARKKIANSGYIKNIEKLAEAEVSDAKKIVKKLSSNRFSSILGGFWQS